MVPAAVWARKGRAAGEQLVEEDAEGEEVRAGIHGIAAHLLGRHHPAGAEDGAVAGQLLVAALPPAIQDPAGDAEVGDLDPPVRRHQDVLRLQVPVHHPLPVGVHQGSGDGDGDPQAFRQGQRTLLEEVAQRRPRDVLHDDGVRIGVRVGQEVEHLDDGGMGERSGHPGLAAEPSPAVIFEAAKAGARADALDRHLPVEPRVIGQEDLAHAAGAQALDHLVGADRGPRGAHWGTCMVSAGPDP